MLRHGCVQPPDLSQYKTQNTAGVIQGYAQRPLPASYYTSDFEIWVATYCDKVFEIKQSQRKKKNIPESTSMQINRFKLAHHWHIDSAVWILLTFLTIKEPKESICKAAFRPKLQQKRTSSRFLSHFQWDSTRNGCDSTATFAADFLVTAVHITLRRPNTCLRKVTTRLRAEKSHQYIFCSQLVAAASWFRHKETEAVC